MLVTLSELLSDKLLIIVEQEKLNKKDEKWKD